MKFTILTILSVIASAVYAQTPDAGVAVTLPSLGQVLQAGSSFTITWTVNASSSTASKNINSIALMEGSSSNLQTYIPNILSAPIPVNPPSYNWQIPHTVETNPSYVLVLTGDNGGRTYSTYFTILGVAPGTNVTTLTTSSAVTSSATGSASTGNPTAKPTTSGDKTPSSSNTAATTTSTSGASNFKAGMIGVAGIAVAVTALLL
ncbi:uncharacterized protein BX663DRAFT_501143 [Cokeromyces recurvatus]|uniref:uncharacterized protein n=1 Tax=Cokeromyces recurvatus TaxID=90255 RepID=UPI00222085A5|nr:uncharacterized protein BX663DRAFT_501143 [Cokeromyces recurvatus]KAI7904957.1 hypothetical protein BX663DRAFT_501143 [Cokeromyces recurvatus]